jgi:hypothetical protein
MLQLFKMFNEGLLMKLVALTFDFQLCVLLCIVNSIHGFYHDFVVIVHYINHM